MPKSRNALASLPKPLWPKIRERVKFAFSDKRPFTLNAKKPKKEGTPTGTVIKIIWVLGFASMEMVAVISVKMVLASIILFIVALTLCLTTASPVIKRREEIMRKMFEIGRSTLGLSSDYAESPQAVISIMEWRDITAPSKVRYEVPTTFGADSEENFQRQFNQIFGTETTWVPFNDPEKGTPGWNYADGQVTLKETPPLPQRAPWDEHYVLDPSIAWSFFPIALGVENGVELVNPATGETENVLGFDLAGNQPELSKKLGVACGSEITTSPMVLCLDGDTLVVMKDRSKISIRNLAEQNSDGTVTFDVLAMTPDNEVVTRPMVNVRLTRFNSKAVRILFVSGEEIYCTPDHLFRLASGDYIRADELTTKSKLSPIEDEAMKIWDVQEAEPRDMYDGSVPDTENFIVGFPNSNKMVVIHNCGGGTGGGKSLAVDTLISVKKQKQ